MPDPPSVSSEPACSAYSRPPRTSKQLTGMKKLAVNDDSLHVAGVPRQLIRTPVEQISSSEAEMDVPNTEALQGRIAKCYR